jgi:hypothetical protein
VSLSVVRVETRNNEWDSSQSAGKPSLLDTKEVLGWHGRLLMIHSVKTKTINILTIIALLYLTASVV